MKGIGRRFSGLLAGLMMLAMAASVQADVSSATIEGRAVNAANGRALAGVMVSLSPSGKRVRTGRKGSFAFSGLKAGRYRLTARKSGFAGAASAITLPRGSVVKVVLSLKPLAKTKPANKEEDERAVVAQPSKADATRGVVRGIGSIRASKSRVYRKVKRRPRVYLGKASVSSRAYGSGGGGSAGMLKSRRHYAIAAAPAPMVMRPSPPPKDREGYDHISENAFRGVKAAPLSTFSIDVDTAAYANVRRFLNGHRLPPKGAVRIEELINYFPYAYSGPTSRHPFAVHSEVSGAPWNPAHRLVRIGVQGKRLATKNLPPSNLVFLLDVSGSMHSPAKLPLLKRSLAMLVQELRPQDRVSITVYAGAAGLVLPPTSGADQNTILAALEGLRAGGSTAGGAGIRLAYKVARETYMKGGNNRVILATDGDFNVGQSSDSELVSMIEKQRKSGVYLTVLGFGTGNYQDAKMQKLADKGNGNHAYIDSLLEARKVLVNEMGGTLVTIAKDVKIQVEFNPTLVKGYRLIGYENRMLKARDFKDDKKDAGELGAGHSVTALYEIIPAGSKELLVAVDRLKYQAVATTKAAYTSGELMTVKLRYKPPTRSKSILLSAPVLDRHVALSNTSADFRFASAVAEFGLLLRKSPHKGKASYAAVVKRARNALGKDAAGYRFEFVKLVQKAAILGRTASR